MSSILIAEDNPANRELIRTMLGIIGYEVLEAEDGDEALQLLETSTPDLILMDLQMPKLDGFETLRRLRGNPSIAHVRVIAVSAYAMRGDKEKALAAGFDGYLTKPIDRQSLIAELKLQLQDPQGDTETKSSHQERNGRGR